MRVTVGMGQMLVIGGAVADNLTRAVRMEVSPPPAQGTELLALLRSRGYEGP